MLVNTAQIPKINRALFTLFEQRLLVQNRRQQRVVDFDMAVVADEPELAKLVHEMADPGSGGADHLGQCFLADIRADPLWLAFLAEIREQQKQPSKSPLARIEQLVD